MKKAIMLALATIVGGAMIKKVFEHGYKEGSLEAQISDLERRCAELEKRRGEGK